MTGSRDDRKLVDILYKYGLLTDDQVRRVLSTIDGGKDIGWALSHLPLVEHLHYLKAKSVIDAASRGGSYSLTPFPTPLPSSGTPEYEVKIDDNPQWTPLPISSSPPLRSAQDDEEDSDVPTLELEDMEGVNGFEGVGRPMSGTATPPESNPAPTPYPFPRKPATHYPSSPAKPAGCPDPEGYMRPGVPPPMYDLSDDEGIPLVNRVNALFSESLSNGVRQIRLSPIPGGMEITSITEFNTDGISNVVETDEGLKIGNRLKIMARIEPWKKPPQRGTFVIQQNKRQVRVLVDITASPIPDGEEIVLYILSNV